MDHAGSQLGADAEMTDVNDSRQAPRFRLLIRAAKLISADGEFLCVIRDVSSNGISVKLFHSLPEVKEIELELQCGDRFKLERRWIKGREAGFEFTDPVNADRLIAEVCKFPKRGLRLGVRFPAKLKSMSGISDACVTNLSQQGARLKCEQRFAIDQNLRLDAPGMPEIRAKVRWRDGGQYGVVFDDTFTLQALAVVAAQLQCPDLLKE